jgi:hypothetical protein
VSLFVLSSEIKDRDKVEIATGRSTKRPSTLNDTGCLIKNDPRYNFAIDNPNGKKYTGNEMALKTLET